MPPADAIVSSGHPLNYLTSREQIDDALAAACDSLRVGGVLAVDVCDLEFGRARDAAPPHVRIEDDWVLVTNFSAQRPDRFVREMTIFTRRDGECWGRTFERHYNVLIDTQSLPALLAAHGVDATVRDAFGTETNPTGLMAVVGRKTR